MKLILDQHIWPHDTIYLLKEPVEFEFEGEDQLNFLEFRGIVVAARSINQLAEEFWNSIRERVESGEDYSSYLTVYSK